MSNEIASAIKLFLITGFLGSGKTTCLNKLLQRYSELRCGVLENEFGEISIDAALLPKKDIQLEEINSGSIFCSCRHDSFIEALIRLASYPLDILFIESSGMADPACLETDLKVVEQQIGYIYQYNGTICIVDALNFQDLFDVSPVIEWQIKYANLILLNKEDLVESDQKDSIQSQIQSINPNAIVFSTSFGEIPEDILETTFDLSLLPPPKESLNRCDNRPSDLVLTADHALDYQQVYEFIQNLAFEALRIKGFVNCENRWHYFESVNKSVIENKLEDKPSNISQSELMIIFRPEVDLTLIDLVQKEWKKIITIS